ncbi:diguanylate cyclase domain-containing protein [Treponema sp.]|uniref:transporter substrate-binding domain-containing diguanylate cyclase n=1 Tax=Treponema sp. TaxID=166 RepID=UPI003890550E
MYDKHGNDNNSSYISEFLENINRYSDFTFEYVKVDRSQLTKALKSGLIDMIPFCGRDADSSGSLLFSDIPCAIGSTVFASNRMPDMENLKIGLLNHAPESLREKVFFYVKNQGINATYFYYDSSEQLISDIYNGKIDVFTTIDFTIPSDFFVIATIETTFFYLAVSNSNPELFYEFNSALSTLFLLNPSFLSTLRARYIPSARYSINKLSPREQTYVRNNKNMKVAVVMNEPPYCFLSNGEFRGIIIDLIDALAKSAGITVTYVPAYSYLEAMNLVKWGEADIIYNINELILKSDLASIKPTSPLLSQKFIFVSNSSLKKDESVYFVEIRGIQYSKEFIDSHFKVTDKISVDTAEECFAKIEKNDNYISLIPLPQLEYYLQNHLFTNLKMINEGYSASVSLGISRRLGSEMAGVLDKAIYTLTTSMFESFMERNMDSNMTVGAFIKKHLVSFCIICAAFILVLASAVFLFVIFETRRRKDNQIKQAMNLANRDSMTGLFNHIAFEKKVTGILMHQEENETGVFVMIDIDDFKKVNDTLGHAKGDYVIVSVANLLLSTFRGGDLKGRMGGDEFAVFMRNVSDLSAVERKMKFLQDSIKTYFEESELPVKVTCSIGISWCKGKQNENAFKEIYNAADQGLYQVKKNGKNAFVIVEASSLQS